MTGSLLMFASCGEDRDFGSGDMPGGGAGAEAGESSSAGQSAAGTSSSTPAEGGGGAESGALVPGGAGGDVPIEAAGAGGVGSPEEAGGAAGAGCVGNFTGPTCELPEIAFVPADFYLGPESAAIALSNDGKVMVFNTGGAYSEVGMMTDFDTDSTVGVDLAALKSSGRWAFGIDQDGTTIVGQSLEGDEYVPFKRVGQTATLLDTSPLALPGSGSAASDVSADGSTIVGSINDTSAGRSEAFSCKAGSCEYIADWQAGDSGHFAYGVSGDGGVVVGYATGQNALPARGFRWTRSNKKTTTLQMPSGTWSNPAVSGVSRNGNVVVGSVTIGGVLHAVRWTGSAGTAEDLGIGSALATSADGQVTVGADNSGNAAVWIGTKRQTLTALLGSNPELTGVKPFILAAVSDDGKVVVGTATIDAKDRAFMARLP